MQSTAAATLQVAESDRHGDGESETPRQRALTPIDAFTVDDVFEEGESSNTTAAAAAVASLERDAAVVAAAPLKPATLPVPPLDLSRTAARQLSGDDRVRQQLKKKKSPGRKKSKQQALLPVSATRGPAAAPWIWHSYVCGWRAKRKSTPFCGACISRLRTNARGWQLRAHTASRQCRRISSSNYSGSSSSGRGARCPLHRPLRPITCSRRSRSGSQWRPAGVSTVRCGRSGDGLAMRGH